jgi:hypothetical protein
LKSYLSDILSNSHLFFSFSYCIFVATTNKKSKIKYNGEEIKCKSFAAKDTAKGKYPKYCKLKLDLLTNATVVDDAIRFVSSKIKEKLKSSTDGDKEESNEPDYDEDEDQLEEEQEEETGVSTARNRIF